MATSKDDRASTMNNDTGKSRKIDPALSAAYRDIAIECAPEKLDTIVMDTARREVKRENGTTWRDAWYRPVTFIATAGLSLALILQLSHYGIFEPAGMTDDGLNGVVPVSESAFQDAAERTAERIRQLEVEAERSMEAPRQAAPVAVPDATPADVGSLLPADDRCTDEQRANSRSWWQCIQDLEKRGLTGAAEQELQALLRAHPQFTVPDQAPPAY